MTIYALTALFTIVAGLVTLASGTREGAAGWRSFWGGGYVMLGIGMAVFTLPALDRAFRVSAGAILSLCGAVLVTQGVRLLAGRNPHWPRLFAALLAVSLVPLLSHDPAHRLQRIAYIDYTMMIVDIWAAVTALRLARHERLRTAWMLGGTFVLTAVIGFGRGSLSTAFALGMNSHFDFINNIWMAMALAACWPMRGNLPTLVAAERAERALLRLATEDALTGALNRTGLDRLRARMTGRAGLILIDLDHFKALNDRMGHAEGDRTLQLVAAAVREVGGPGSRFARLGGDEFLLVLPGRSLAVAAQTADRVCAAVEEAVLAHRRSEWGRFGDLPPVTASIGVASGNVAGEGFAALLAEADEALYRSKRAGRNQVSLVRDAA